MINKLNLIKKIYLSLIIIQFCYFFYFDANLKIIFVTLMNSEICLKAVIIAPTKSVGGWFRGTARFPVWVPLSHSIP